VRIILDTNVLVSGLFFKGIPFKILRGAKQGIFRIVVTEDIVEEYRQTLEKLSSDFPGIDPGPQLELIILSCEICQPKKLTDPICRDRDDDMFLACALASGVKVIVSGDKLLRQTSGYRKIEVLTPRQFADCYLR